MDVQTENTDSPPGESQPSAKIRKGFKLFGKRKPGNIFSIRSKSEGNNKSPLNRSKTLDGGGPEASESEPDGEKEKLQGDEEQQMTEEEPMGEDGVLAAAPARTSISSASSAKSLGFLSILRGGRRGVGDRRVHTVSQPVGRQRRGIKGLFGKFQSKDKDEKEESQDVPPSPLLMSSRSNSVEIIKEDLTLTPKSPRALDSPGTESSEPSKSLTALDSSTATSPSKTVTPGDVSNTNEPVPTTQAAMVPGETSLSSLLADISSLLTFDSISGGGDIMADVEAEWGKASSALSATDTSPSYAKPIVSPLTTASVTTTAKPLVTFTLPTISTQPSSPMKPSSIITTLTKSSTLTTAKSTTGSHLDSSTSVTTQPLKPVTNISAPIMSSPPITSIKTTTSAPPNITATTTKAPLDSPSITAMFNRLASEQRTETPKTTESKPSPLAAPSPLALTKTTTPATQSPPATFTQSSTTKPDLTSSLQVNKAPVMVSVTSTITAQPSPPTPLISSKMTTTTEPAPISVSSVSISKPATTTDLNKTAPSIVSETSISKSLSKPQPSSVSVPFSSSISQVPPVTTPAVPPVSMNGMPPPAKISPAMTSLQSQSLSNGSQVSPAPVAPSVPKEPPLSASQPKVTLAPVNSAPSQPKVSIAPAEIAPPLYKTPATQTIPITPPQIPPALLQPAFFQSTPMPSLSRDGSDKKRQSSQSSLDGHLTSPKSPEARDILQQDSTHIKEDKKRASQVHHTTGLSKIPVVGGGKAKIPVRASQPSEEEPNKDVSMSMPEDASPHFNSHDTVSKDKIANSEVVPAVATSKHSQEESQQQQKQSTCFPRDSKIPVKHSSQIPQAKDPARTKIPVSKVPVRRAQTGAKPAAPSSSGSTQIRK